MPAFDPYEVLDIPRDADAAAVRRAYQKLARRHHPDLTPGDSVAHERFERVRWAYRILGDPERRRRFDAGRAEALRRAEREARVRGAVRTGRIGSESFLEIRAEWMEWIDTEQGEGASSSSTSEGADLEAELTLDFAEAVRGVTRSFSVQRERPCEACDGLGAGAGGGTCTPCAGRGAVVELDRIRVRIPAGVGDGTLLRLPGKGRDPQPFSGDPGDLRLTVRVRPHPYFHRSGLDVHAEVPITFAEAALGAEIEVPTLDGPVKVRLPGGTQGGQRFRLRERGIRRNGGPVGDHYYTVRIVVPETLDPELEAALRAAAREKGDGSPRGDLPREPV